MISIVMHRDSSAADILQAFIHALVMAKLVGEGKGTHLESQLWMEKHYKDLVLKVSQMNSSKLCSFFLFSHNSSNVFLVVMAASIFKMENRTSSVTFSRLEG